MAPSGRIEPIATRVKTIVAVSPNSLNNDQFQRFSKEAVNKTISIASHQWTVEELKACRKHIFEQVPEDLILEFFDEYHDMFFGNRHARES